MYTTPRKVKQESRLRRSLSLTNTSRLTGATAGMSSMTADSAADEYSSGEYHRHIHDIEASKNSNTYFQFNGDIVLQQQQRSRFSYTNGGGEDPLTLDRIPNPDDLALVDDSSIVVHPNQYQNSTHKPPPYRGPPPGEVVFGAQSDESSLIVVTPSSDPQHQGVPDSPLSIDSLQTHSSKFPFTLDSSTAKDIQKRLANYPITRTSSADLGKAIQEFNDEQTFLMQQPLNGGNQSTGNLQQSASTVVNSPDDLAVTNCSTINNSSFSTSRHHPNNAVKAAAFYSTSGNKMSSGYSYSDSASQSLSSSNTDSLDTVIYKGASQQSTTSIRDWQRSMESSNGDFGHGHRHDPNNAFRDAAPMFDARSSYHHQMSHPSQTPSYSQQQQQQYNGSAATGGNNYAIEYRHSQQQHQVHQNLSVHSVPSSSCTGNNGGNVGSTAPAAASNGAVFRSGNGATYGSNPQLPTKSPMLTHKQFAPMNHQGQLDRDTAGGSHRVTFSAPDHQLISGDKQQQSHSKESAKLFPTKTYNHIKDMISSRFGHGSNNSSSSNATSAPPPPKHLNNSNSSSNMSNGSATSATVPNNNTSHSHGGQNSYIDLTMGVPSSYQNHGHHHPHSQQFNGSAAAHNSVKNSQQYFPQQQQQLTTVASNSNNSYPNSYRSPNMSERKNVNTSFRKAIQQSTLKSNLAEESLQLRPIVESSSVSQQQNYPVNNNNPRNSHQVAYPGKMSSQHSSEDIGVQQERAQRALDKLMEAGVHNGHGPSAGPSVFNRAQQFSPGGGNPTSPVVGANDRQPHPHLSPQSYSHSHQIKPHFSHAEGPNPSGLVVRPSYNSIKPGPASSNSNSSSGLVPGVDSSLSSPGSYSNGPSHNGIDDNGSGGNNKWTHYPGPNNNSASPSKNPKGDQGSKGSHQEHGSMNTIGLPSLPSLAEVRENGDGSSGTMDLPSTTHPSNMSLLESSCSKAKSDQLHQITTDLQNIALSVAVEQHLHHGNGSSSSECEKGPQRVGSGQSHTTTDSGLGGTVMLTKSPLTSNSDPSEHAGVTDGHPNADSVSSNDSEWVDLVEPEIRQILDLERSSKCTSKNSRLPQLGHPDKIAGLATSTPTTSSVTKVFHNQVLPSTKPNSANPGASTSTQAPTSAGTNAMADISASPILHPKGKASKSPQNSPKPPKKFDLNAYNKKTTRTQSQELLAGPSTSQAVTNPKVKSPRVAAKVQRSNSGNNQRWPSRPRVADKSSKATGSRHKDLNLKGAKLTRNTMTKLGQLLNSLQDETGDITSTTGLDFESAFDGQTECTTDDDDLSTTIDTTDAHAIRRQLESLESMYTEVLKVLGEKKFSRNRYPPNSSDLRGAKRRPYGSMSSLPSSVSSRPFRERSRKLEDKKKVKDLKSINRRFQRLESHVVTLARSVAHLSSEMRTQHLMVQEMDSIRNELQQLRNQVVKNSMQAQSGNHNFNRVSSGRHGANPCNQTDWTAFRNALPSWTNPCRVRKLTKFFGDEPPLIRIFLKKLGYEKYASAFEQERIGIMELPYLTEERLNKMGIPMGPRLRILQEAQMCLKPGYHGHHDNANHHHPNNHNAGNLSVYVV